MSSHAAAEPYAHERNDADTSADAHGWLAALLRASVTHERIGLRILLTAAAALHLAVVFGCPRSFGYIYDFYPAAVAYVYDHHALPPPEACWICAHPPLLWILGAPFYAAGMWLSGGSRAVAERALCLLPLLCDALIVVSCYQFLRLYRRRGLGLWIGMSLCALLPCLAISACAPESDVLLTALMTAGLVQVCRVHFADRPQHRQALAIGALSGLALLTKYSGVLLLFAAVVVYAARAWRARALPALRHACVVVCSAAALCGAQYGYNLLSRHELLVANGSARSGFAVLDVSERRKNLAHYDFGPLRIREAVALFDAQTPGTLDEQPVYASVWTSLHAMAWTDMSMFSVHSRHGDPSLPYPNKQIPRALVAWLLTLGLLPSALTLLGMWEGWRAPSRWPLTVYGAASMALYVWWFLAQDSWALKTKYLLFLLPVYALLATDGLERVLHLPGRAGAATAATALTGLGGLFACAACYIAVFALG
jgi:4-amino-4-deoxy-L-arabinose transferase-like glycosyltransferase